MKYSFKQFFYVTIILAITFVAYFPSLKAGFTNWDDDAHVVRNPDIRQLDAEHVERIFTSRIARTYIPLTLLSYSLEYHFFKLNPFIYHLNNILLHLCVVILVFVVAKRFGLNQAASAWAALIFAIHPMHVESVAWVSERKDVLCAVFYLLALLSYWTYRNQEKFKWWWWIFSVILGFLSMLAKPMAYSLPLVFLLIDWWHRRKFSPGIMLDKIPHAGYVLALGWMTLSSNKIHLTFHFFQVILIWCWSFLFFPFKFLIPSFYVAIYKLPEPVVFSNPVYAVSLIALLIVIGSLMYFSRQRFYVLAWLFYGLTISMIVVRGVWDFGNNTVVADRFMYIPGLGFCIFFGFLINHFQHRLKQNYIQKIAFYTGLLIALAFLGVKTYQQCFVWKDNLVLWTNVIKYNPHVSRAYVNRAQAYVEKKEFELAFKDLNTALTADAEGVQNERLYLIRGSIYLHQNNTESALNDFNQALQINPHQYDALMQRGNLWAHKREYDKALKDFYTALIVRRESPQAYINLAEIYQNLGELDKTLPLYREALQLDPGNTEIQTNHEMLLKELNLRNK